MSKTKFTPGPWFAHGPINANRRDWGVTASRPYDPSVGAMRRIAWVGNAASPHDGLADEINANAHLVASAPDLYQALLEARAMLRSCGLEEADDEYQASWDRGLTTIDKALAKAHGEST